MLRETFTELLTDYGADPGLIHALWTEIEQHYTDKSRYYHTLQHLADLLTQLTAIKGAIQDWDTILFTLYYHDIIYRATATDNEEKSAEVAEKRLKQVAVPADKIARCKQQILATKSHVVSADSDTNYFTDADLTVLGQDWESYAVYFKSIRKEYAVYPDGIYHKGRKKVLSHFLTMERIFKTDFFYRKFEAQAKLNLTEELNHLVNIAGINL